MNMFFYPCAAFFGNLKKIKKTVARFPFRSYKEMQGKKLAKAVTIFVLLRIRK